MSLTFVVMQVTKSPKVEYRSDALSIESICSAPHQPRNLIIIKYLKQLLFFIFTLPPPKLLNVVVLGDFCSNLSLCSPCISGKNGISIALLSKVPHNDSAAHSPIHTHIQAYTHTLMMANYHPGFRHNHQEQFRVQCLAQVHFNMPGGVGDSTTASCLVDDLLYLLNHSHLATLSSSTRNSRNCNKW